MTAPICPTCGQQTISAERRLRNEIRDALDASEMLQKDLAERLGVSQKHMSQLLSGRSGLSLDMAEKILAILGRRVSIAVDEIGPGT